MTHHFHDHQTQYEHLTNTGYHQNFKALNLSNIHHCCLNVVHLLYLFHFAVQIRLGISAGKITVKS